MLPSSLIEAIEPRDPVFIVREAVGRLDLSAGAKIECFGLQNLGPTNGILLQGHRTGVNGDGGTTYWFTGRLTLPDADVDILVTDGRLSPDSTEFTGTARVAPQVTGDCTRYWPFETVRVEERQVPSVFNMTREEAFATLQAEGFAVRSTAVVDPSCNYFDLVVRQDPPAGALALPGSLVRIYIGTQPPPPRCQ